MTEPKNDPELYERLGLMNGKLDSLMEMHAKTDEEVNSLRERTASLERSRSWFVGVGAVVSFVVAFITYNIRALEALFK